MRSYDAAVTTIGFGVLGIFVASIFWYLNKEKIWIDQMITGSTSMEDIMIIVIVIFLLVGVILAAMRSR